MRKQIIDGIQDEDGILNQYRLLWCELLLRGEAEDSMSLEMEENKTQKRYNQ